jgi:hypothetical protein
VAATEGEAVAFTAAVEAVSTAVEGSVAAATAAVAATAERATSVADIVVDTDIAAGMATEADTTVAGAAVMVMAGEVTGGADIGATRVTDGVGRTGALDSDGDTPIMVMVITATPVTIPTILIVRRAIRVRITETMEGTRHHRLRIPTPTAARIGLRTQESIPGGLLRRREPLRTTQITTGRLMGHDHLLSRLIT